MHGTDTKRRQYSTQQRVCCHSGATEAIQQQEFCCSFSAIFGVTCTKCRSGSKPALVVCHSILTPNTKYNFADCMKKISIICFLVSLFALKGLCQLPLSLTSKIDTAFSHFNKTSSPGCAIAIIKDGKVVFFQRIWHG